MQEVPIKTTRMWMSKISKLGKLHHSSVDYHTVQWTIEYGYGNARVAALIQVSTQSPFSIWFFWFWIFSPLWIVTHHIYKEAKKQRTLKHMGITHKNSTYGKKRLKKHWIIVHFSCLDQLCCFYFLASFLALPFPPRLCYLSMLKFA